MIEAATPDAVIDALRNMNARRIGIDGIDGCGKTSLAKVIATKPQRRFLSLNDYLERDKGRFLDFIDYPRLHADASSEKVFVIEGVCLLHALQNGKPAIDTLV